VGGSTVNYASKVETACEIEQWRKGQSKVSNPGRRRQIDQDELFDEGRAGGTSRG
jgi:hypothetical protein